MSMRHLYLATVASIGACVAASASAQSSAIDPFRQCAAIAVDAARLACFDRALQAAETAIARARQRTHEDFGLTEVQRERLNREQSAAEQARAERDGRAVPGAPKPEPEAEPARVTARVSEIFRDASGRRIFLLENGQLWRQQANSSFRGEISNGETVTIERGTLAGFRLTIDGRPGFVGVRRVR